MDFGVLPPEVNSGRMYAGAGSGPLLAAAAAWSSVASDLSSAASSYRSTLAELTADWLGPSSRSMAAAVAPYVAWMNTTAAQAEQAASQASAAAAAYETAFLAHVPPPLIAANRASLMSLIATNVLGQNTPAIAATEAHYAEMWAQDAAAMYGYAGASASATTLTPFSSPKHDTNPAGTTAQATAVASASATSTGTARNAVSSLTSPITGALQSLASGGTSFDPATALMGILTSPLSSALNPLIGSLGADSSAIWGPMFIGDLVLPFVEPLWATPHAAAAAASAAAPAAAAADLAGVSGTPGLGGPQVSGTLGRATTVGGLSVPPSWATTSPAIRLAATGLPIADLDGLRATGPGNWFGGLPPMGSVVNAPRTGGASDSRQRVIPQLAAPPAEENTAVRKPKPKRNEPDVLDALSALERAQLYELRKEFAELALERDAAARLIKEAIRR